MGSPIESGKNSPQMAAERAKEALQRGNTSELTSIALALFRTPKINETLPRLDLPRDQMKRLLGALPGVTVEEEDENFVVSKTYPGQRVTGSVDFSATVRSVYRPDGVLIQTRGIFNTPEGYTLPNVADGYVDYSVEETPNGVKYTRIERHRFNGPNDSALDTDTQAGFKRLGDPQTEEERERLQRTASIIDGVYPPSLPGKRPLELEQVITDIQGLVNDSRVQIIYGKRESPIAIIVFAASYGFSKEQPSLAITDTFFLEKNVEGKLRATVWQRHNLLMTVNQEEYYNNKERFQNRVVFYTYDEQNDGMVIGRETLQGDNISPDNLQGARLLWEAYLTPSSVQVEGTKLYNARVYDNDNPDGHIDDEALTWEDIVSMDTLPSSGALSIRGLISVEEKTKRSFIQGLLHGNIITRIVTADSLPDGKQVRVELVQGRLTRRGIKRYSLVVEDKPQEDANEN